MYDLRSGGELQFGDGRRELHAWTRLSQAGRGDASGACFSSAEAAAARGALETALAALPQPQSAALHEVLPGTKTNHGEGIAFLRCVCAERGASGGDGDAAKPFLLDGGAALWDTPARPFWSSDPDFIPEVALLTHTFTLPDGRLLALRTLRGMDGRSMDDKLQPHSDAMLCAIFGDASRAVLRSSAAATAVSFNGRVISDAAELAPMRKAVNAALKAQVLSSLCLCLRARWAGGFLSLRRAAVPILGVAAPLATEPLAQALLLQRGGGANSPPVPGIGRMGGASRLLWNSRTWQAEALEAAGEFTAAAAIYARNIEEVTHPERCAPWEHVRPDTLANLLPIYLSYQGLAMKRAGAFGEAEALYEAGLRHIASSACARIVPPERESLRIMLLRLLITLHSAAGTERKSHDAFARLFQRWSC